MEPELTKCIHETLQLHAIHLKTAWNFLPERYCFMITVRSELNWLNQIIKANHISWSSTLLINIDTWFSRQNLIEKADQSRPVEFHYPITSYPLYKSISIILKKNIQIFFWRRETTTKFFSNQGIFTNFSTAFSQFCMFFENHSHCMYATCKK